MNWLQSVSSFTKVSGSMDRCGSKCLRDLRFSIAKCHLEKGISIYLKVNSFARTLQINNTLDCARNMQASNSTRCMIE